MYDKQTDSELNNFEVWLSVSYKTRIFVAAKSKEDIYENIDKEQALRCIDSHGEQAKDDFQINVYDEATYQPPVIRQPIEDFNNGDWDYSL